MRIRSIKPEFWRSRTVAEFDWATRLVLKGVESYVDDNGVGKDDLELIAGDVFPRDLSRSPRETCKRLSEAITKLTEGGLLVRYEVDGEKLLYVDRWKSLQRIDKPTRGRYPRPDGTYNYSEVVNREAYGSIPEILASPPEELAPVTGEQGNRGTETTNVKPSRFDEFWEAYPRKVAKKVAQQRWDTHMRAGVDPQVIITATRAYARSVVGKQPQHIKQPDGWLLGQRWEDQLTSGPRSAVATHGTEAWG